MFKIIRVLLDPELLPGSGAGTLKGRSWIRIRNKSFRIHNNASIPDATASCDHCLYYLCVVRVG